MYLSRPVQGLCPLEVRAPVYARPIETNQVVEQVPVRQVPRRAAAIKADLRRRHVDQLLADQGGSRAIEQGARSDHVVDIPAAEGGEQSENAQGCYRNGGESREDEDEVEEEQLIGQSQRPARIRRPPDRYGEWILNSLQQITDRLKMLEDKQRQDKERIKKLKPKLLKKARTLREH
ncbi:hypothetical protein ACROYT_G009567 [Oculina patagonica]